MIDLSGQWRFRPADGEWTSIAVPGFWEAQGFLELDGYATYERDVELDDDLPHAVLEFDAVADLCEIFVNDEHVGSHEVGFTPFGFDVSFRRGRNVVRVEVHDPGRGDPDFMRTPQGKQGWGNVPFPSPPSIYITYGGIWQPCRIVPHIGAYVSDVWCDMDPSGPTVLVECAGSDEIEVRAFGQVLREGFRFEPGAEVWSPSNPVLHDVEVTALVDGRRSHTRRIRTGLRTIERDGDDVLINGAPYRMRSALHQGFWPGGLYAADPDLIERDVQLALDAGLNTLRTHLKAFEPAWLDASDARGLLIHADLPIGEPLREETLLSDPTFVRRCLIAAREQVRRDRSRPAIVVWTLLNEVGLMNPSLLSSEPYRALVAQLHDAVCELDPSRPIVENDWVLSPKNLVRADVRTAHWYGRTTVEFMRDLDTKLEQAAADSGPFYVSEFGEWGLPSPERESAFWDQDDELRALVTAAGWRGSYDDLVAQTQDAQGWADRIQAERFRTAAHVHGFCLTEWTDVPHELNGLVTLRRNAKRAVETFRPALSDVAPIALLDRYAYAEGEGITPRLFVSNWSPHALDAGELKLSLGHSSGRIAVPPIEAGGVVELETSCVLRAARGALELRYGDAVASYPIHVCASAAPTSGVVVAFGEAPAERPAVLIEPTSLPDGWPELEKVPTTWGPTPVPFTSDALPSLPSQGVLAHEVFACYPEFVITGTHGPLGLLVAPPIGKWGALIAKRDGLVVCTLRIAEALERGEGFAQAVLADLVALVD